jgi:hypothetical protein
MSHTTNTTTTSSTATGTAGTRVTAVTRESLVELEGMLTRAACPEDVFGALAGADLAARRDALQKVYRTLSRACHPDLAAPDDRTLAGDVFVLLSDWRRRADAKLDADTYGDRSAPSPAGYRPTTLTVRGRDLKLTHLLGEGTFATVHSAEIGGRNQGAFVKVARDPADNDLLEREEAALRRLAEPDPRTAVEEFLENQRTYAPYALEAFLVPSAVPGGAPHRATLLSVAPGRRFTARALREQKFPDGVEPKHVWWIFRRLLLTLWMGHLKGLAHGAVTPDHLLVYPEEHGIVLIDWTCSAELNVEHVPALNPEWAAFYPPEVPARQPAGPETDIFMAAATAVYLLGGDPATGAVPPTVPAPCARFLRRCLDPDRARRPQDAEEAHEKFGGILEAVHGKRRYAEFIVP